MRFFANRYKNKQKGENSSNFTVWLLSFCGGGQQKSIILFTLADDYFFMRKEDCIHWQTSDVTFKAVYVWRKPLTLYWPLQTTSTQVVHRIGTLRWWWLKQDVSFQTEQLNVCVCSDPNYMVLSKLLGNPGTENMSSWIFVCELPEWKPCSEQDKQDFKIPAGSEGRLLWFTVHAFSTKATSQPKGDINVDAIGNLHELMEIHPAG